MITTDGHIWEEMITPVRAQIWSPVADVNFLLGRQLVVFTQSQVLGPRFVGSWPIIIVRLKFHAGGGTRL